MPQAEANHIEKILTNPKFARTTSPSCLLQLKNCLAFVQNSPLFSTKASATWFRSSYATGGGMSKKAASKTLMKQAPLSHTKQTALCQISKSRPLGSSFPLDLHPPVTFFAQNFFLSMACSLFGIGKKRFFCR